jgi:hypothetical protein
MEPTYLNELRSRVERLFGRAIKTKQDANELSLFIRDRQKENLSPSTLRRFFALVKPTRPSSVTLNILSRLVGYESYQDFSLAQSALVANGPEISTHYFSLKSLTDSLQLKDRLNTFEVRLLSELIRYNFKDQNILALQHFFTDLKVYQLLTADEITADIFAQSIGNQVLELKDRDLQYLLNTKYFISIYVNHYVDVGNYRFDRMYRMASEKADILEGDIIFFNSVLSINAFYRQEIKIGERHLSILSELETEPGHPVLAGRLALLRWIKNRDDDELMAAAAAFQTEIDTFSMDLMAYFLLNKERQILAKWIRRFEDQLTKGSAWYSHTTKVYYRLARAILHDSSLPPASELSLQGLKSRAIYDQVINSVLKN